MDSSCSEDWSMIPIGNHRYDRAPPKLLLKSSSLLKHKGSFALDIGVDALLCKDCKESSDCPSIRLEESTAEDSFHEEIKQHVELSLMTITEIKEAFWNRVH